MRRRTLWLLANQSPWSCWPWLGGTWFYFNVISEDAPAPLTFEVSDEQTGATRGGEALEPGTLAGTWRTTTASRVGYRVDEVAFGQSRVAAGGANAVTGELILDATEVRSAAFTADMTEVTSDEDHRDGWFHGRIMDTANHPNATFRLSSPIRFDTVPADGQEATYEVTGDLTLRGITKPATFPVKARRNGNTIEVNGTIPIVFAEWNIPNPSIGPISTEDRRVLEFLIVFDKG